MMYLQRLLREAVEIRVYCESLTRLRAGDSLTRFCSGEETGGRDSVVDESSKDFINKLSKLVKTG